MRKRRNNILILSQLIHEHAAYERLRNSDNNIVIHIRTGDVIDSQPWTVSEFLYKERNYRNKPDGCPGGKGKGYIYVKTLNYYKQIIKKVRRKGLGSNLTIVTGFHKAGDHSKSIDYIDRIKNYFEVNGFKVTTRINSDPDEDFIYCSTSKYYIPSGGGFSDLICKMVKYNSGKCLKSSTGL